ALRPHSSARRIAEPALLTLERSVLRRIDPAGLLIQRAVPTHRLRLSRHVMKPADVSASYAASHIWSTSRCYENFCEEITAFNTSSMPKVMATSSPHAGQDWKGSFLSNSMRLTAQASRRRGSRSRT